MPYMDTMGMLMANISIGLVKSTKHQKHLLGGSIFSTPWKTNMEPTNHPFRKENDLPNLQGIMYHVTLQGCIVENPSS